MLRSFIHLRLEQRDKDRHYMINRSIQQEDIILVNIYTNRGAPNYIRQLLTDLKGEIDSKTVE